LFIYIPFIHPYIGCGNVSPSLTIWLADARWAWFTDEIAIVTMRKETALLIGVAAVAGLTPWACWRVYKQWWIGKSGFDKAREDARRTYEEHLENAGRRAQIVMANLDVLDDMSSMAEILEAPAGIDTRIPFAAAYKYSRLVRCRMSYPARSKANMLVAADHLRTLLEENNVRKNVAAILMPLALEMVFVRDKNELQASTFASMIRGTWREAGELAA